jgi:hypothetical protein
MRISLNDPVLDLNNEGNWMRNARTPLCLRSEQNSSSAAEALLADRNFVFLTAGLPETNHD